MPQTSHVERHFSGGQVVRDVVIGMSDGLTVPFALAAALSGVVDSSGIVVTAGLAEIAAGSIAMGLGGYLAGKGDQEHYASEKRREEKEVREIPEHEAEEVRKIFRDMGLGDAEIEPVVSSLRKRPGAWVDFMMRMELGLEKPDPKRAYRSALTIGLAYVLGGMIPLASYFFISDARTSLGVSIAVTAVALAGFGYVKGVFTGAKPFRTTLETLLVGGLAAAAAFTIARSFS
jgi:VIT1/CCC1 family predicted Fe2+/Mn2+ transporter